MDGVLATAVTTNPTATAYVNMSGSGEDLAVKYNQQQQQLIIQQQKYSQQYHLQQQQHQQQQQQHLQSLIAYPQMQQHQQRVYPQNIYQSQQQQQPPQQHLYSSNGQILSYAAAVPPVQHQQLHPHNLSLNASQQNELIAKSWRDLNRSKIYFKPY
jgi:hypothetical protein